MPGLSDDRLMRRQHALVLVVVVAVGLRAAPAIACGVVRSDPIRIHEEPPASADVHASIAGFRGHAAARMGLDPVSQARYLVIEHPHLQPQTRAVKVVVSTVHRYTWKAWFRPSGRDRTVLFDGNRCDDEFGDMPTLSPGEEFCVAVVAEDGAGHLTAGNIATCDRVVACLPVIAWFSPSCRDVPPVTYWWEPEDLAPPLLEPPVVDLPRKLVGAIAALVVVLVGGVLFRRRRRTLV